MNFTMCRTSVHAAAFNNNVESLQMLFRHNVDLNTRDSQGRTPIMMASNFGHTNVVGRPNVLYVNCM